MDGHQLDEMSLKKCPELLCPVLTRKLHDEQIGCGDVSRRGSLILRMSFDRQLVSRQDHVWK